MSEAIRWSENDALFKSLLARGQEMERWVAAKLQSSGFAAHCPPQSVRQSIKDAPNYADQVDVVVTRTNRYAPPVHLEVKERPDLAFTCPEDIPSHLMPFFITTRSSWQDCPRSKRPHVFVIVSGKTGSMVCIGASTQEGWSEVNAPDYKRGIASERFLCADRKLWRSYDHLVGWLDQVGCDHLIGREGVV